MRHAALGSATRRSSAARGLDLPKLVKESLLAALVAFGLAIFIIGLRIVDVQGGLALEARWSWVGIAVGAVFIGRLALAARRQLRFGAPGKPLVKLGVLPHFSYRSFANVAGPVLIVFAIVLPFLPFANRYVVDIATLVMTYIMLGWGLNIVVGLAGLLDLGYVAFYAIGAYSFALLAMHADWGFWACLPLAGVFAALFGLLLGFPVLRLRGDYLAIVTLAFGEMVRIILINWFAVTNGPNGISDIPRPSFFGVPFAAKPPEGVTSFHMLFGVEYSSLQRIVFLYYLILALALVTNVFTLRIRRLPIGRAWEALREDEIASRSLGINPTNTKLTAFAIGAMFGGFAGSFFAARQGFVSPESFTFIESATILAIVVLGGMGSQIGVVLAATILIGGTELLRELEEYRMLAFGAAMVAIMVWRPRGLLAHRAPTVRLYRERGRPSSPP
jgi:branched-chain amino acid transport system permease protein